jgi:hypothetical protein
MDGNSIAVLSDLDDAVEVRKIDVRGDTLGV